MVIEAGPPVVSDESDDERNDSEWLDNLINSMKENTISLDHTYLEPDSSCLVPYSNEISLNDAAFALSEVVYESFKRVVAHSLYATTTNNTSASGFVLLEDPEYFFFGKYKFHWTVFLHGVRRGNGRDRSAWDSRSKLVPFEQLRRDLAKFGIYLLLRYINHVPCPCVFLKGTPRWDMLKKSQATGGKLAWIDAENDTIDHPYQIVPH